MGNQHIEKSNQSLKRKRIEVEASVVSLLMFRDDSPESTDQSRRIHQEYLGSW